MSFGAALGLYGRFRVGTLELGLYGHLRVRHHARRDHGRRLRWRLVVWATMMTRDITFSQTFIGSHLGKTAHGHGRAKLEHYILLAPLGSLDTISRLPLQLNQDGGSSTKACKSL